MASRRRSRLRLAELIEIGIRNGSIVVDLSGHRVPSRKIHLSFWIYTLSVSGCAIARSNDKCWNCGKKFKIIYRHGEITSVDSCKKTSGFSSSFTIPVNSGKLVLANDLRVYWGWHRDFMLDNEHPSSMRAVSEAYAEKGMLHCFIGDTSPKIYLSNRRQIVIANMTEEESQKLKLKQIGQLKTDIYWYCAADFALLAKQVGYKTTFSEIIKDNNTTIIDVTPGRYKGTMELKPDNTHDNGVYSKIYKARERKKVSSSKKKVAKKAKKKSRSK